jgi:hypothetical protein
VAEWVTVCWDMYVGGGRWLMSYQHTCQGCMPMLPASIQAVGVIQSLTMEGVPYGTDPA